MTEPVIKSGIYWAACPVSHALAATQMREAMQILQGIHEGVKPNTLERVRHCIRVIDTWSGALTPVIPGLAAALEAPIYTWDCQ